MKNWRFVLFGLVLTLAAVFSAGYFFGSYRTTKLLEPQILIGDKYRVVRTPGGMLQVATLVKQESLAWQTSWTCPVNLCSFLPTANSQISVEAQYTYRIPLSEYWVLEKISESPLRYKLKVPRLEPQLPVTVNLPTIRIQNSGTVFSPSGPTQQKMQTFLQPELETRSKSAAYLQIVRSDAEKTIKEFAQKWLRDGDVKIPVGAEIEVVL
jgi:hypothetical protein